MIDKLKLAIDRKDWALVVEFYRQLTGTLESPMAPSAAPPSAREPSKKVPEVRKKNDLDDFTMRPVERTLGKRKAVAAVETKPAKPARGKKKKPVKAKEIEFVDTGELPDEPGFDQINDNVPLTPRTRKPFKPVEMKCTLCKATETVAPLFKRDPEVYKCTKCLLKGKINGPE